MRRAICSIALGVLCVACAAVSHAAQVTQPMNVSLTIGTPGGAVSLVVGSLVLAGPASGPAYGTTTVDVNATSGLSYSISLDPGLHMGAGGTTSRNLVAATGVIPYSLFRDPSLAQLWGDGSVLGPPVNGVGTGSSQSYTVVGTTSTLPSPPPNGVYTDVVTVSVNF